LTGNTEFVFRYRRNSRDNRLGEGTEIEITGIPVDREALLNRTKRLLRQYGLQARKGLGQHFLINPAVLDEIVLAAGLVPSDLVIEVGPGLGVLTRALAARAGRVIAVELDAGLASLLKEAFADFPNVSIVQGNILDIEPLDLCQAAGVPLSPPVIGNCDYKLVANLPYYITQPVLRHFCETNCKPRLMTVMVQAEVARNLTASPGDLSILGVAMQYYGRPEIAGSVPAEDFYPRPKVDSAIVKIEMYSEPCVPVASEGHFFKIVRAGFCAARKQLANSLAQGLDLPKSDVLFLMQKAGIDPAKRAEMLTLAEWAALEKVFAEVEKRC
jgi:16S rRNA (adenine1518-N6/adenine1519-N6)-dimethyltransferase